MPINQNAKKVFVFCDIFPPPFVGGAEFSIVDEVGSLSELGCTVHVFSLKSRSKKILGKDLARTDVSYQVREYFDFPYHPGLDGSNRSKGEKFFWQFLHIMSIPHFYSIFRIAHKIKPDVIYCGNIAGWSLTPWVLSKILGLPIVQHVHDYGFICFRRTLMHKKSKVENCAGKCLSCIPRKVVTKLFWPGGTLVFVSEKQRKLHKLEKLNLGSLTSVTSAPTISKFPNSFTPTNQRDFEYGYLGRISPEKGIEFALSALEKLGKKLFLAGDGSDKYERLLKLRYPGAVFLGRKDKWNFLGNVRILIVPSLWNEPAGRIVKEALIAGCVVFVSNRGGLVEMGEILPGNLRVFDLENNDSLLKLLEKFSYESVIVPDYKFYENLEFEKNKLAKLIIATPEDKKNL